VDVIVIARSAPAEPLALALAADLDHSSLPCPARKLELVVYPRDAARRPSRRPRFSLNLNTGAGLATHRSLDPREEPSHWFLLDLALARDGGRSLLGPPPEAVVGPIARSAVLEALADSLDWHAAHEGAHADAVLNACRAWRFAVEGGSLGSKEEGAAWARERATDRELIDAALAARRSGAEAVLPLGRVAGVVGAARAAVAAARG
jgi:hypothetical protein